LGAAGEFFPGGIRILGTTCFSQEPAGPGVPGEFAEKPLVLPAANGGIFNGGPTKKRPDRSWM
jgi:hypothetical protein